MRLVKGSGGPGKGACWMSAINYYENGASWTAGLIDRPRCVCPIIRDLAILLNDACPDLEREALIGPHLFDPMGTATLDDSVIVARLCRIADWALNTALPSMFLSPSAPYLRIKTLDDARRALDHLFTDVRQAIVLQALLDAAAAQRPYHSIMGRINTILNAACISNIICTKRGRRSMLDLILSLCQIGEREEVVVDEAMKERTIAEACI